jgi:lipoprotein signal peptidase
VPEWPTFNIADAAIVCGALCILLRAIKPYRSNLPEAARRVIEHR